MPSGIATWQIRKENEIGEDMHMDLPSWSISKSWYTTPGYTHTQAAHSTCVHAQHQGMGCACITAHTHTSSESQAEPDQAVDQGEKRPAKYKPLQQWTLAIPSAASPKSKNTKNRKNSQSCSTCLRSPLNQTKIHKLARRRRAGKSKPPEAILYTNNSF
jgi:hypothetical protein